MKLIKIGERLNFLSKNNLVLKDMVGRVGYAPTTPAMSMQYSTIELTALIKFYLKKKTMQVI